MEEHPQIGAGELVSISEAALRSGFSRSIIDRWVKEGRIPAFGHRYAIRVRLSDVLAPRYPDRYRAFREREREDEDRRERERREREDEDRRERERERKERRLKRLRAWVAGTPPPAGIPRADDRRAVRRRPLCPPDPPAAAPAEPAAALGEPAAPGDVHPVEVYP